MTEKDSKVQDEQSKFVDVDGQQVLVLTPDYQRPLAIVDLAVIKRLASYLPKADIFDIRSAFIDKLNNTYSIKEYVDVIAEELAFHKSVNLIDEVDISESAKVVGKVPLDEGDLDDLD